MKSKTINFNFGSMVQNTYGRKQHHSGELKNEIKLKESVSLQKDPQPKPLITVTEEFAEDQKADDTNSFAELET